jgi:signal transduction histidine kinase
MSSPDCQTAVSAREVNAAWSYEAAAGDLLNVLAHEMRDRLHLLALNTELMLAETRTRSGELPGPLAQRLTVHAAGLRSMKQIMERLLEAQRAEHTALEPMRSVTDLRELAMEVLRANADALNSAECSYALSAPRAVAGRWDALMLRIAINNLVSNAIKFGAGRPIEVAVSLSGEQASLRVTDHGRGIRPEDRERIFGRFERGVTTAPGFGLGLWIVRGIAHAHDGEVALESVPGQGASFTLQLPVAR